MDLSSEHDGGEDQKEETLEAEQNEEDDGRWRREATALWKDEERIAQSKSQTHLGESLRAEMSVARVLLTCPVFLEAVNKMEGRHDKGMEGY